MLFLAALAVLPAFAAPAGAATYPNGFEERTLVSGLLEPAAMAWAPDGRLFIAEKRGALKVVAPGSSTANVLIDIGDRVNDYADHGFLGVAVDGDFAANPYLYLLYTYDLQPLTPDSDRPMVSRLTRIKLAPNGSVVNPAAPETVLLGSYVSGPCPAPANAVDCIPSDEPSHTIGTVRSAPDGTLWVGSGDGASYERVDPLALRALDERSLGGKIMHVDRNGRGLPGHPFCPANANLGDVCTKLHAKGFRNPFRFTLRPGGGVVVGDVGWEASEEINLIGTGPGEGGRSYGWPCYEAESRTTGYEELDQCALEYVKEGTPSANVRPDFSYPHESQNNAVVAGPTYLGNEYPPGYRNSIFFGDYAAGFMKRLTLDAAGRVTGAVNFADGWSGTDLEAIPGSGDLAYLDFGYGYEQSGSVRQIAYSPGNRTPVAAATAVPSSGGAPLTTRLDGSASSDPDGDALTYRWDFGDGSPPATTVSPQHTYAAIGTYTATLTVDDGRGRTNTDTVTVTAGNTPPAAPVILTPSADSLYRNGRPLALRGSGSDPQDGELPATGFSWNVRLMHDDHVHPLTDRAGASSEFTPRTDHDADSFYEITLTARDSGGLTASTTIRVLPETVGLELLSSPAGIRVSYGGRALTTPFAGRTAIGLFTSVSAPAAFSRDGRDYRFARWSDGGARLHDITVPASDLRLTASYEEELPPSASPSADPSSGPAPLRVRLDGSGSRDPNGDALTYRWDFGDGSPPSSEASPEHVYLRPGSYSATLTVTDATGRTGTGSLTLAAANTAPAKPRIETPANGSLYRDGQPLTLRGSGTDPQDGELPGSALGWNVRLVHAGHEHPRVTREGSQTAFTPRTDHDADARYEVTLSARDSDGLTASTTVELLPATVGLSLRSSPVGVALSYAGRRLTTPFSGSAAIGFVTTVSAPATFTARGAQYRFDRWSDGGARLHGVTVPAGDLRLTASYRTLARAPRRGPSVEFKRSRGLGGGGRLLRGVATDPDRVRGVDVAVARRAGSRCRWWSRRLRALTTRTRLCRKPVWMRATIRRGLTRTGWRISLRGRLAPDSYRLHFRAVDGRGDRSRGIRNAGRPVLLRVAPRARPR